MTPQFNRQYSFNAPFLRLACLALFGLSAMGAGAQDTTRKREVNITSTFKPYLKEAAKININASPAVPDTSRPRLQYNIPNQNLSFSFQPGTLKPLALQVDTGGKWNSDSYVKVGYGSLRTPYVQAGLSVGDGHNMGVNVYARHYSSHGKLKLQEMLHTNVDLNAFFKTSKNLEWNARFGGQQEQYFKYGAQPDSLVFPLDSVKVRFQSWTGRVSFHNINRTEFGISFAPEFKLESLTDRLKNAESNMYFNVPLKKTIGTAFEANVAVEINLTRYKPEDKSATNNNFITIAPSVLYKRSFLNLQVGIRPSWNNSVFLMLPNIMAEIKTADTRFSFQAGWLGYLRNSGFRYMAEMNPWIWAPVTVNNSRIEERYAGFKGAMGDHFSYGVKIAYNKINDQPLFINDTMSGKSFIVVNEPEMKVLNFGGEMGFTVGEKFSILSNLTFNQYKTKVNEKAWGLLPMEWTTTMRIQVIRDLYATATAYAFNGPQSYTKAGRKDLSGAMDLSGGLEFRILKNWKLWAQFNNILGQQYMRWNQYPSYGFNFLGGVVFSFAQKN